MASPTVAANAYANLAKILDTGGAGKSGESNGPSFSALLKDAIGSVAGHKVPVALDAPATAERILAAVHSVRAEAGR